MKTTITIATDLQLKKEFKELAKKNDTNITKVINKCIKKYVKKNREKENELFI